MPSIVAHRIFAAMALELAPEWLAVHSDVLKLGSQGPDPFFFYGRVPWHHRPQSSELAVFANRIHEQHPREWFGPLLQSICSLEVSKQPQAFALVYGLLLHYQLDRYVHPYVYSKTGVDPEGKLAPPFSIWHNRFETFLDIALRQYVITNGSFSSERLLPRDCLPGNSAEIKNLSTWLASVFPSNLHEDSYFFSWHDMRHIFGLLHDPFGIKQGLLGLLNQNGSQISVMIHPSHLDSVLAERYLNMQHKSWIDPVSGAPRSESVPDLIAAALAELPTLHALLEQTQKQGYIVKGWDVFFRDTNHEGHLPEAVKKHYHLFRFE